MLVVIPVGQTHDQNPPNTQTAGGENATVWEGIDPDGAHATAEAVAWAGSIPKTSVTPDHPSVSSVPLKKLGDNTVWTGTCYELSVSRDACQGKIEHIGEPIEKFDVPLRIEVRRVKKKVSGAIKTGLTAGVVTVLIAIDLHGVDGATEVIIDGVLAGTVTGGLVYLLPDILGNEINRDVDEDGNSAYQDGTLEHDPVAYLETITRSDSSAWGTFAGDSFNVSRESHTHDGIGLHPDP
ncbi:MAG: hypothetical protein OXT69_06735 [Candidatus Poribacteria bacterium]|nr:hypothetical protein [Candidatus Poribacteria bacterium]